MFLCTPWTIVTGSLAYNDLAVVALLSAGMLAALDEGLTPARARRARGVSVGAACGCKPTALLFAAPVGIALLATIPPRIWIRTVLVGSIAGILDPRPVAHPQLAGVPEPVFPLAADIFGPPTGPRTSSTATPRPFHFTARSWIACD